MPSRQTTVFDRRGRDRLSLVARILDVALEGIIKTQIMYRANLNFLQLNDYLSFLMKQMLIEQTEKNGKTLYKTTAKGERLLGAYQKIKSLLSTESVEETTKRPLIVAIIPAYNEERTIAKVILATQKHVDKVIVCDDGSTDMTTEIAEGLGAEVVRHNRNMGYGAALQCLFERARELGADIVITLDGDGQHNPNEIPALMKPILKDDVAVAVGSRFLDREKTESVPLYRRLSRKALTKLVRVGTNSKIRDAQCGFRAYGRKALEGLEVFESGVGVNLEILMKAKESGLKVVEVPIGSSYHGGKRLKRN
ncbi:MAG: glycosyltransferase [Candidatus Bathyarchaeota archaeon]|nr:glycosyltransferase [Candidatus Bathyarchaeota archaeon]